MTNRIEKRIFLRASRARVWRALSTASEFSTWFGIQLDGEMVANQPIIGTLTSKAHAGKKLELQIGKIEPESYLAYRWHPFALDASVDYSLEPTTLVEFELHDADGGTQLTIRETGFDQIPEARRAAAFKANTGGWDAQAVNIEKHVAGA